LSKDFHVASWGISWFYFFDGFVDRMNAVVGLPTNNYK